MSGYVKDPISPSKASSSAAAQSYSNAPLPPSAEYRKMEETLARVAAVVAAVNDGVSSASSGSKRTKRDDLPRPLFADSSPNVVVVTMDGGFKRPMPDPARKALDFTHPPTPSMRQYSPLPAPTLGQLPTPTFSDWDARPSSSPQFSKTPPPLTPKARRSSAMRESPYEQQHLQLKDGLFHYQGRVFQVSYFAKGTFSNVYIFNQQTPSIIPSVGDNSTLVLKAFHGEVDTGFLEGILKIYLQNSLDNYRAVQGLGLPVATIYNLDSAIGDRVIIQSKIPHPINFSDASQMAQVQNFFGLSIESGVPMDLQPANLRVDDKGTVVLIDFVEDEDLILLPAITLACSAWCKVFKESGLTKDQARTQLEQITADFFNKHPDFNTAWLERILNS